MATPETISLMAVRYGRDFARQADSLPLKSSLRLGPAEVSFHPAGHVLGSAQIRLAFPDGIVVVSGDYKREADPTCASFELVPCDIFVTEATFGLPVFRHAETGREIAKLMASRDLFPERAHLVGCYALGKAQRIMALLRQAGYERPIYIHGAIQRLTEFYTAQGCALGPIENVAGQDRAKLGGEIVICPPSALQDRWARRFDDPVIAFASGWMRVRARARQRGVELPLVISDHADWDGLCATIRETGCERLYVTHGEADALVHWAQGQGLEAEPLHILGYGDEDDAVDPETTAAAQG